MTRPQILLDCDPGIDDAFALMCAFKYADVAAITTVSGNVGIDKTTRNARYLVGLADLEIPVHRGAASPLEVDRHAADEIHGASGLGNISVGEPPVPESSTPAIDAIFEHCSEAGTGENVVVATGPLTNIALALQRDPTLAQRISHLYWMGGSTTVGNVTARAEFNAWADPHAVDETMRSGIPLTMFGLNLTHQVRLGPDSIDQLGNDDSDTAKIFADLLGYYHEHGAQDPAGQPVHDTCAVLGFTHPELFSTVESNIVAHITNDDRRGMTETSTPTDTAGVHHVAETADAPAVIELVMAAARDPRPATRGAAS